MTNDDILKQYDEIHRERRRLYAKQYYQDHAEEIKAKAHLRYLKRKEKKLEARRLARLQRESSTSES